MINKIIFPIVFFFMAISYLFVIPKDVSAGYSCGGSYNCCFGLNTCCWAWFVYPNCGDGGVCWNYEIAPCAGVCQPPYSCSLVQEQTRQNCQNAGGWVCTGGMQPEPGPGCYETTNYCGGGGGCEFMCGDGICCATDGETIDNCQVDCDTGGGGGGDPDSFTVSGFIGFDANDDGVWNDGDANKVEDTYQSDCGAFYNLSPAADLRISWINNSVGGDLGEIHYHTDCAPSYSKTYQNDGEYDFTLNNLPAGYSVYAIDHNVAAGCTLVGNTATCGQLSDNNAYTINFFIKSNTPPATPLPCPTGFNVSCAPSGNQVTISWNNLTGAVSYFLRLNKIPYDDWYNPGGGDFALESVNPSQTHDITAGSEYKYDVQGRKPGEPWPYSGARCPYATFTCIEPRSCNVTSVSANPSSIAIGEQSSIGASVTAQGGTINSVNFTSSPNPDGSVTLSGQNPDPAPAPYGVTATGVTAGGVTITATATMDDLITTCTGNTSLTISRQAWWQVIDADVSTNGSLISLVPPSASYYFDVLGSGGYPGIPAYGLGGSTNLTTTNVSEEGWLAQSGYNASKRYDYNYFHSAIPSGVTPEVIGVNPMPDNYIADNYDDDIGNIDSQGYHWYESDGGSMDYLTINSESLTNKKVILLVNNSVNLTGQINLTRGLGFFLLASSGNIAVDPGVGGGGTPNLEGIFVSDGEFQTGTETDGSRNIFDSQLRVRGTVASYGTIRLQRNLGSGNDTTPAQLFELAPDLILHFPNALGTRNMNWQEVAP